MARFKVDAVTRNGRRTTYEFDLPNGVELTHLRVNANGYLIHDTGVAHRLQSVHHGAYDLSSLREVVSTASETVREVEVIREVEVPVVEYRFPDRIVEEHWDPNGNNINVTIRHDDPDLSTRRGFVNGQRHSLGGTQRVALLTVSCPEPYESNPVGFNASVLTEDGVEYNQILYLRNRLDTL